MRAHMVSLTQARTKLFEVVRQAMEAPVYLLRHGKPIGVLLGYDAYNRMLDHIEELEDQLSVHEARAEDPLMHVPADKVAADAGLLG